MASFIALEWDSRQARVAIGHGQGEVVVVEQAFAVALEGGEGDEASSRSVSERLRAAFASRGLADAEVLVAVGRSSIELRPLVIPPAPEEELPEMVKMQAPRAFSTLGDDWPVDFLPLSGSTTQTWSVLAAAISPTILNQIRKTVTDAGLTLGRLVLRPFAAASLVLRSRKDASGVRMVVDLLADEADLTVVDERQVMLARTVRLPAAGPGVDQSRALIGEIRRTLAAVSNELAGRKVSQIVICGTSSEHSSLQAQVQKDLGLEVALFDPFSMVKTTGEAARQSLSDSGRFAPVLGMLADEATATTPAIDFLHPRQKPPPPNPWRMYTLIGLTATVAVLAVAAWLWMDLIDKDNRLRAAAQKKVQLEGEMKVLKKQAAQVRELDVWSASAVNWLDELAELSRRAPPAEDFRIAIWLVNVGSNPGGSLQLDGYARSPEVPLDIGRKVTDARHHVRSSSSKEDESDPRYGYLFRQMIVVDPKADGDAPAPAIPAKGTKGGAP